MVTGELDLLKQKLANSKKSTEEKAREKERLERQVKA
jgi:hypothetical protein